MFRWYCPSNVILNPVIFRGLLHRKTRITLASRQPVLVFNSEYNDPYLNLAYENWLYENVDFAKQDILFFWRNSPCVVLGRHQNPWLECDGRFLKKHGIQLARRYSGGGTVYHDLGNLNVTFLTSRARYNRRRNLDTIARALCDEWDLNVDISSRDDLLVDGLYKVSGSAAKLGKHAAYHHCTLLCEADVDVLQKAVSSRGLVAKSRSTQSVRSQVVNLKDIEPLVSFDGIIDSIIRAYCKSNKDACVLSLEMFKQYSSEIDETKLELQSWEWVYGKTAPFILSYPLLLSSGTKVTISLEVVAGVIKRFALTPSETLTSCEALLQKYLIGTPFIFYDIALIMNKSLESCSNSSDESIRQHIQEILSCILDKC